MTVAFSTPQSDDADRPTSKVDPETMVLRAKPARPIRFKRGIIVGIAAVGTFGLMATAWLALEPSSPLLVHPVGNKDLLAKASGDTLSKLPTNYGDAPKLGPPLPGDLGRPILAHQRAMAAEGVDSPDAISTEDHAVSAPENRLAAEQAAARQSGLLVKMAGSTPDGAGKPSAELPASAMPQSAPPTGAINLDNDPNGQQRKIDFLSSSDRRASSAGRIERAESPYTLIAGSVIAASLITGLRSDVPGLVIAQVTQRVFDTATGQLELIPQGARLIGSYDSVVAFGQRRAFVVWQRIIFPDGGSISIDNVPATDVSGYAGLEDKVDLHTWTLLKGVAVSSLLGVGSNLAFSNGSDLVQAIRQSSQQNASRAGDQLTSSNLRVQPTLTIRPGARVRLVVHRNLVLGPISHTGEASWRN